MKITLKNYEDIIGKSIIDELKLIATKLKGKKIQHINSTKVGGGVAEMLNRIVPLFKEMGVDVSWDIIEGNKEFFDVTKKFHNALHGRKEQITQKDFDIYTQTSQNYIKKTKITDEY